MEEKKKKNGNKYNESPLLFGREDGSQGTVTFLSGSLRGSSPVLDFVCRQSRANVPSHLPFPSSNTYNHISLSFLISQVHPLSQFSCSCSSELQWLLPPILHSLPPPIPILTINWTLPPSGPSCPLLIATSNGSSRTLPLGSPSSSNAPQMLPYPTKVSLNSPSIRSFRTSTGEFRTLNLQSNPNAWKKAILGLRIPRRCSRYQHCWRRMGAWLASRTATSFAAPISTSHWFGSFEGMSGR